MKASERGQVECVKVLLDRGAKVNLLCKVSGIDVNSLPMHIIKNATNLITGGYICNLSTNLSFGTLDVQCTVVQQLVLCLCTVSDIGGTPMMICTYHYRMDGPH